MTTLELRPGTFQQSTFTKVGYDQHYDSIFLNSGAYKVTIPLKLNSGTAITKDPDVEPATITLASAVTETVFPSMTPIFGQAKTTIQDILLENITFDGNAAAQTVTWGKGFHNLVGILRGKNIVIRGCTAGNSQGDIARLIDCEDIEFYENTVLGGGHDGLYVERSTGVEAWKNKIYARVNSGLRSKGSKGVYFHDNDIQRSPAYNPSTGPLIQVENSRANETTSDVVIENNYLAYARGPGIWAAGHSTIALDAAKDLVIKGNTIVDCGQMPVSIEAVAKVCGISVDGWDQVRIENNLIDGNFGGGIHFSPYLTTSAGTGYRATVKGNTICNTKKESERVRWCGNRKRRKVHPRN
ncbi:right-handed parallel beta-helix repeat-containing protein [Methanosarcina horonobensis]|uniref:right-handed parallel beta-helix repeat-containing protein n=1 Tax=Methanosarcina horonobensis TaxID=418008 RepID=UPI000B2DDA74|nr:right-handed parallel beta-helix repeat-containing protein [Methanosarcina horonobensis]